MLCAARPACTSSEPRLAPPLGGASWAVPLCPRPLPCSPDRATLEASRRSLEIARFKETSLGARRRRGLRPVPPRSWHLPRAGPSRAGPRSALQSESCSWQKRGSHWPHAGTRQDREPVSSLSGLNLLVFHSRGACPGHLPSEAPWHTRLRGDSSSGSGGAGGCALAIVPARWLTDPARGSRPSPLILVHLSAWRKKPGPMPHPTLENKFPGVHDYTL